MFLVDTNVWLERLLDQERAGEVGEFLDSVEAAQLLISEFSLYSIGIALCKLGKDEVFEDFVADTLVDSGVRRVRLNTQDLGHLLAARQRFRLDFDDAYQYVAAAEAGATIVSFDVDFDRTDRGRKTPAEGLAESRGRSGEQG
jgi:predicted nucleic acid-binding protein